LEIKELTSENFDKAVSEGTVLVDVFTSWCGPCKMLAPVVASAADEATHAKFFKLNAEEASDICNRYEIRSVPTLLIFRDGKLANTSVGVISKAQILDLVK
jgi:thioredoxin 1